DTPGAEPRPWCTPSSNWSSRRWPSREAAAGRTGTGAGRGTAREEPRMAGLTRAVDTGFGGGGPPRERAWFDRLRDLGYEGFIRSFQGPARVRAVSPAGRPDPVTGTNGGAPGSVPGAGRPSQVARDPQEGRPSLPVDGQRGLVRVLGVPHLHL